MGKKSQDKRKEREKQAQAEASAEVEACDDLLPIEALESESLNSEVMKKLKASNIDTVSQVIAENMGQEFSEVEKQQILQAMEKLTKSLKLKADLFIEETSSEFKRLADANPSQKKQFEALCNSIREYRCDLNILAQVNRVVEDKSLCKSYKYHARLLKDQEKKACSSSSSSSRQKKKKEKKLLGKKKPEEQEEPEEEDALEKEKPEEEAAELRLLKDKFAHL